MSNFIYGKTKEAILNGEINFSLHQFKAVLVNSNYIPSINADQYVSDIPLNALSTRTNFFVNVSNTLGTIDAEDLAIASHDGSAFNAVVIYRSNTSDSDSRLIAYIGTAEGIPFNGSNSNDVPITIVWNNEVGKILSL